MKSNNFSAMVDEFEIHSNKRTDRTYISPSIDVKHPLTGDVRQIRIVSKVLDSPNEQIFAKIKDELIIRVTPQNRQELVAKLYEDNRGVFNLTFQKFTRKTGNPHKQSFSFVGEEIKRIIDFINNLTDIPFDKSESSKLDDQTLKEIRLSKEQAQKLIKGNEDVILEIVRHDITKYDIVTLGYRKKQLMAFEKLLSNQDFFEKSKSLKNVKNDEALWQLFFEKNTWIFGYGLNFFFNSPLDNARLEQVVAGYDFQSAGKRVDALLKTRGLINSLCFVEIKTPDTKLIKEVKTPYRSECWQVSDELSGAIAQIHKTVQKSLTNLSTKIEMIDHAGNPTGEKVFLYQPKSFLVIGNLNEFMKDKGINESKFSSFELFRRNLSSPEILTYDELYERAKFIIRHHE